MSDNISISVNYAKPAPQAETPKEIVIYHWNRIFSVFFLAVFLIGALVYALKRSPVPEASPELEKPIAAPLIQAPEIPVKSDKPEVADSQAVKIYSSAIKRAQITHGLHDQEPIDALGSVIALQSSPLRLYFFMEASGHKKIFHDWYWNGKRVERNKILIHHKLQKTASARSIAASQTGSWLIQAVDEKGKVLAKASFETVRSK